MKGPLIYLIPSLLNETGSQAIPGYVLDAIKNCEVFFAENERTARRYFKKIWKVFLPGQEILIDNYEWQVMNNSLETSAAFIKKINEGKIIGIISEAGCPGIADPGQDLISIAQAMNIKIKPLVGPNSILLALMASGMNGQQFYFHGYLPVKNPERNRVIKDLESASEKKKATQIFIETPYRNKQIVEAICTTCKPTTKLCIAVDITGETEWIKTLTIEEWSKEFKSGKTDFHKRPAIFLIQAGS